VGDIVQPEDAPKPAAEPKPAPQPEEKPAAPRGQETILVPAE